MAQKKYSFYNIFIHIAIKMEDKKKKVVTKVKEICTTYNINTNNPNIKKKKIKKFSIAEIVKVFFIILDVYFSREYL